MSGLLLVAGGVVFLLTLDAILQRGITTVGPRMTQTDVRLAGVNLSPWSGRGEITGFVVANPQGFSSPSAIQVGRASIVLKPTSLFAEKLIIRSIQVEAPEITLEGGLKRNNLTQLLDNIRGQAQPSSRRAGGAGSGNDEEVGAGQTRLQVDEFILKDATVRYAMPGLGGLGFSFKLPPIELRELGQDRDGITLAELFRHVLDALHRQVEGGAARGTFSLQPKAQVPDSLEGAGQ